MSTVPCILVDLAQQGVVFPGSTIERELFTLSPDCRRIEEGVIKEYNQWVKAPLELQFRRSYPKNKIECTFTWAGSGESKLEVCFGPESVSDILHYLDLLEREGVKSVTYMPGSEHDTIMSLLELRQLLQSYATDAG